MAKRILNFREITLSMVIGFLIGLPIAGMVAGFAVAVALELAYPGYLPWAYGLTSGAVALAVNLAIYVAAAYLLPQSREEKQRVEELFALVEERRPSGQPAPGAAPQAA